MSGGKKRAKTPGVSMRILLGALALMLVLMLSLFVLLSPASRLVHDRALYLSLTEETMPQQLTQVHAAVDRAAETYHFSASAGQAVVTEESLQAYWTQVVDWTLGLFGDDPNYFEPPAWDAEPLAEAVRQDEQFQQTVDALERRSYARDVVAAAVAEEVERTMMPLRPQVIAKGAHMLSSRMDIPRAVKLIQLIPWAVLGAAVVIAVMLLALSMRYHLAPLYLGSGLLAAAGLGALGLLGVHLLDIAGACAQVSGSMAALVGALGHRLGWQLSGSCLVLALLGAVLLGWEAHERRRA